jgi:Ca-activated chloride channel family protein
MKRNVVKPLVIIGSLIVVTCAALAYSGGKTPKVNPPTPPPPVSSREGILTLSGRLTQDKIFIGGDGTTSLDLTLTADDVTAPDPSSRRQVDMVVVLDRSGSMEGRKLHDARRAVLDLIGQLSAGDRFALISYANTVHRHSALLPVTAGSRERLFSEVKRIQAGGGTNLGAGLDLGMTTLKKAPKTGSLGRLILISDGLANEGVTDPLALGNMAAAAREHDFAVSTVGVGNDFNETLMTAIADRGTGNYYYLENPAAFAEVFQQEFRNTLAAAATGVTVTVPLSGGMTLIDASGYPVHIRDNAAVFHPGDLRSGQTRNFFLTFRVPARKETRFEIKDIAVAYTHGDVRHTAVLSDPFKIACVKNQADAFASIRKKSWERKVLQEDYGKLKDQVAADIRSGKAPQALEKIRKYQADQQAVNAVVGSARVEENLKEDVSRLEGMVQETFSGPADEVQTKQKRAAKALQFESYKDRRAK